MKITIYLQLFTLFFLFSCDTEDVDGLQAQTQSFEDITSSQNPGEILNNVPCEYDLNDIIANSTTVTIDCILDLNQQTVTIPADVQLEFDGGQITNGTLSFSEGATVDSRLLNQTLKIDGQPTLKNNTFEFFPGRWGIVEGTTTSENALKNTERLESLMATAKQYGATTFSIYRLDAYFEVSKVTSTTTNRNFYASREAINIPSDFNLVMTNDTHLRVYPNSNQKYSLLAVRDVANVSITGGKLYGDREQHDYSEEGTHEWGTLINLHSAVNVVVTNVTMVEGTGDGLIIHSLGHSFASNYKPSHNVTIRGCTFDSNRRNNLSITDGYDMLVENNTFLNAGIKMKNSTGTFPKFAIDIEALREREDNDELKFYEKAKDIIVRGNTERGSVKGGIIVYIAENVIVEENTVETGLAWSFTINTKIRNNVVTANPNRDVKAGIVGGRSDNIRTTYGNEIYGNVVKNFPTGIIIFSKGNKVYNNTVEECDTGIFMKNLKDTDIYNNRITSNKTNSLGIYAHITTLDKANMYDNIITVKSKSYTFTQVNTTSESQNYEFAVDNQSYLSNQSFNIE